MTVEQLLSLQAIVSTGSFRAAAEQLNKVQSAVSHSVKTLEEELEFEIFDRSNYRPQLTARGRLFLEKANEVIKAHASLKDYSYLLSKNTEPALRISLTSLTPLSELTNLFHEVHKRYKGLQIRLDVLNLRAPLERLEDNEADLAITEFPPPEDGYEVRKCGRVLLQPMAAPSLITPLPESLTQEDLKNYTQIVASDHHTTRTSTTVAVLEGAPRWNVTDFYAKKQLLIAGMGWGNMPLHTVQEEIENGKLIVLPYGEALCTELYLVRKNKKFWGPASQYIWSSLEWD